MAIKRRYELIEGSNFKLDFYFSDKSTGIVRSLTGTNIRMQVRERYDSATAIIEATIDNGSIILEDYTGSTPIIEDAVIYINIPSEDTEGLNFGLAKYDLKLYHVDGTVETVLYGDLAIIRQVTAPEVIPEPEDE